MEIIQNMVSDHKGIKLEISNRRLTVKLSVYLEIKQYVPK